MVHRYGMRRYWLSALTSSLLSVVSCTASGPDLGSGDLESKSSAIVGGQNTNEYPAVAQISITIADGQTFSCSSTLISPRVLLTAAHCIDSEDGPATAITAYFGTKVTGSDPDKIQSIPAIEWTSNGPWSLSGNDIALVLLEYDSDVAPLPYNTQTLGNNVIGLPLHVIGWGNTSYEVGSGSKRHMTTPVTGLRNSSVMTYGNNNNNTCQGDSGGPGLLPFSGGIERVSSITSYGQQGCVGESGATRVAKYKSFIGEWIAQKDVAQPPEVSFVFPVDGSTVKAGFQVHVNASDNTRLESVEIWINDQLAESLLVRLPPFVISTSGIPDGPVKIEARGIDNRGDIGAKTINVTLDSTCSGANSCSGVMVCNDSGYCVSPDFELGEGCSDNEECGSRICATVADEELCSQECTAGDDATCPASFECLKAGDTGYCWPDGGGESGGCSTSGGGTGGLAGLLLVLSLAWRRRQRLL